MPILDDNVVRIFPSGMIGGDNIVTKEVRLGQLILGQLVLD